MPLIFSSWESISALFCQFCELNVLIFVRNFQFFNFSNSIHNSAVVFSSEDVPYGGVGFSKQFPAEIHGRLARESKPAILSIFTQF